MWPRVFPLAFSSTISHSPLWVGYGWEQERPKCGFKAPDDEANQTEEKVTPTDSDDMTQILGGSLDFSPPRGISFVRVVLVGI